jgi:hypothetical protein
LLETTNMRFKYIGLKKDGERAFLDKTGITWMPGEVHDVADAAVAEQMLRHGDVWEPVQAKLADAKVPAAPVPEATTADAPAAPAPAPAPAPKPAKAPAAAKTPKAKK